MAARNTKFLELADTDRQALEAWLIEFDQGWREGCLADRVRVLPPDCPWRGAALLEMVKIDLERQWQRERRVHVESYLKDYPELGTAETVPADLLQAEYEVRRQFGAPADLEEFAQRFPRQVDELRRLVVEAGAEATDTGHHTAALDTLKPSLSTPPPARPVSPPGVLPEPFGRYRILQKLGQGGMGTVYLAHDSQLDRRVALKVPKFSPNDDPEILERFQRETRAAASIDHPNLCPVYDVGEIAGIHYVTMAYLEGKPLAELIKGGKPLPPRPVAALVRKLARALQELHHCGIIHRDLKPSNIMINLRHEPVVMDFGLARRFDKDAAQLTRSGQVLGTPAYMAPEQVAGDLTALGPACDIYSLGVVLYELLAGRVPFKGPMAAVLMQIVMEEPAPPSRYRPDVEPALEAICLKAMARKAEARYGSMAEFAAALTRYLKGEPPRPPEAIPVAQVGIPVAPPAPQVVSVAQPAAEVPEADAGASSEEGLATQLLAELVARLEATAAASAGRTQRPHKARWPWIGATVLLVGAIIGLAALALYRPTVVVQLPPLLIKEIADRDVSVRLNGKLMTPEQLAGPLSLSPGEHRLELEYRDGTVEVHPFTVTRADHGKTIEVPAEAVVPPPGDRPQSPKPAEGSPVQEEERPEAQPFSASIQLVKGKEVFRGAHIYTVTSLAFSPDGSTLATGSDDKTVVVWDVKTVTELFTLNHPGRITCMAFSPDGKKLAVSDDERTVILWDLAARKKQATLTGEWGATQVAFSPDGKILAWADSDVKLWEVATEKQLAAFHHTEHWHGISSMVFAPDGKTLATVNCNNNDVRLWDVDRRKERAWLKGHAHGVYCAAFSPDGKTLATGSIDQTVKLWDMATGEVRTNVRGFGAAITAVTYTPDGLTLLTVTERGTPKLWDMATQQEVPLREVLPTFWRFAFAPDNKTMALVTGDKRAEVELWYVSKVEGKPPTSKKE
jgi:predicted Ser/Thr protein kinase